MKRLLWILISICTINPAYAADAKLNIKVGGTNKDNTYFLCVRGGGCVSMYAAAHGKVYPLDAGKISRIFMVNAKNFRFYPAALPDSCNISVNENQTLTVHGKVVQSSDGSAHINNLECSIS